jgi:RNA polymerase sigma-70 factor, ECF subfamily
MGEWTDEQLMQRFQAGHASPFDLLFQRYRRPLFAFICRMLNGDRPAAEDLLQEIFLKILKARDLYDPRQKFSTWLFAIARNHCLNVLRSRGYRDEQETVPLDTAEPAGANSAAHPPAERIAARAGGTAPTERTEAARLLELAVQTLPPVHREVFLLRAVEGFSHSETAQILRLSAGNVRVHYLRARQLLQKELTRLGWEGATS